MFSYVGLMLSVTRGLTSMIRFSTENLVLSPWAIPEKVGSTLPVNGYMN